MELEREEGQDRKLQKGDYVIFTILAILFLFMRYTPGVNPQDPDLHASMVLYAQGSNLRKSALLLTACVGLFLLMRKHVSLRPIYSRNFLALLCLTYMFYTFISFTWAEEVAISLRRIGGVLCLYIGAIGFIRSYNVKDLQLFIVLLSTAYIVGGLFFEIAVGNFTPFVEGYRFGGFVHPNSVGIYCGFILFVLFAWFEAEEVPAKRLWTGIFFFFIVLLTTRSRTALFAFLIVMMAKWLLDLPLKRKILITSVLGWLCCFMLLLFGMDFLVFLFETGKLGRGDSEVLTLTGRIPLWTEILTNYYVDRPLFGYGYGGFWTSRHLYEVASSQNWTTSSGHSAYVDQLLELGIIGLCFYIAIMFTAMRKCLVWYTNSKHSMYGFLFRCIFFMSLVGLLETNFPTPDYPSFLFLVIMGYVGFGGINESQKSR